MFRMLLILAMLGGGGYVVYAWATSDDDPLKDPGPVGETGGDNLGSTTVHKVPAQGSGLERPKVVRADDEALVVSNCRFSQVHDQELSSQKSGELTVIGIEMPPEEIKDQRDRLPPVEIGFLEIMIVPPKDSGQKPYWRRWKKDDPINPGRIRVSTEERVFRRLREGDVVKEGQLIGIVSPKIIRDEVDIKIKELDQAEHERLATDKIMREAWETFLGIDKAAPGTFSREDWRRARLAYDKYRFDLETKISQIDVRRATIQQALTTMEQHEIRAGISGEVIDLIKSPKESVKEHEPILRIEQHDLLLVEGLVPHELARHVKKGSVVRVEHAHEVAPIMKELVGHSLKINDVAVGRGASPLVVSAGEDKKAIVYQLKKKDGGSGSWTHELIDRFPHESAVTSVACSPAHKGAAANYCLTGTANGVARLWNLDRLMQLHRNGKESAIVQEERELEHRHNGAINCVAFSRDGRWCATGGEDSTIAIYETATGKKAHVIAKAHRGAITSLDFTPAGRLMSAGRDYNMLLWTIQGVKEPTPIQEYPHRSGQVEHLGVGHLGAIVLFDKNNELRCQSVARNDTYAILANTSTGINFSKFALFSPDSQMILTASTEEDFVQLWRSPAIAEADDKGKIVVSTRRPSELRRLNWEKGATTCAAFAPEAPLLVTGTSDHKVLVWDLPTTDEVLDKQDNAELVYVSPRVDNKTVRIRAKLTKRPSGLKVGMTGSIVIKK